MRSFYLPIKNFDVRMDYSKPGLWVAMGLGGSLVGTLSFIQQYSTKNPDDKIRIRSIFRDFCIGAFLTTLIYMFLPESIQSWISAGQSAISNTMKTVQTGGSDIELQVGPARF